MVIADLKQPCPTCDGSGFRAGFNQYGTLLPNNNRHCLTCSGRGYVLTQLGQEVWELFQPLIADMIREALPRPYSPIPVRPAPIENDDEE